MQGQNNEGAMTGGMGHNSGQPRLTALFIDFDNIYISLLSKDKFAATHFATNPLAWTSALLEGGLSTSAIDTGGTAPARRRVIARVYGNPVLKNKDRASFAYVRNHFMHAGYEVIDCPPLTNQLKNGSDIRMVLDMRDLLDHEPRIDEFVIMSGDSDFVPILLRLRAHDRRTMIYGSLQTAKSYTSLSDEIITEDALVAFLHQSAGRRAPRPVLSSHNPAPVDPLLAAKREIIEEVTKIVEASEKPVPMELLATTVRNAVGLKRTIDTKWAGHGQFSVLLAEALSQEFELSSQPPYMVWHKELHQQPAPLPAVAKSEAQQSPEKTEAAKRKNTKHAEIKSVIDNILHLTDIPPLSARYYQRLFQLISEELIEKGFSFNETAENTAARGQAIKLPVDPTHVQAILHRIRRHGHWFGENDTATTLATVFRDSVLSQCLASELEFSDVDLLMINSWFIPASSNKQLPSDEKNPPVPQGKQLQDLKTPAKNTISG